MSESLILRMSLFYDMYYSRHVLSAVCLCILMVFGGCTSITPNSPKTPALLTTTGSSLPPLTLSSALTIRVASLPMGSVLPDIYTCKGLGISPPVSWEGIPPATKSLVLILDDPDAPNGSFTHWIVFNIPPEKGELAQAQPNAKVLAIGAQQGDTSTGSRGYYPPCPPIGETHRYVFRLYAVDMDITQPTADRSSIEWALNGHTLANTEIVTIFKR
ncbi:MAG: YbhB/YbcL family Raf kinase inhibitor-like protein [Methanoregula sp.]|nr:YbhB/YbcL family Raf kinase inhibitor-like protein [Methanoregula sp.]